MKRHAQLVCQQLENVSRELLEEYQPIIRQYTHGRHGVYALYKGDRLHYVGLATDLRRRLKQHLRDKHGQAWDRFSIYITITDIHIRELEALTMRIAHPAGNRQRGRFARCENLARRFARDIRVLQKEELTALGLTRGKREQRPTVENPAVLAPYVPEIRGNRLRGKYKGKTYKARVRKNGTISLPGKRGQVFTSPSLAAIHVLGRKINGWWFWHYERSPGDWARLKYLRKYSQRRIS